MTKTLVRPVIALVGWTLIMLLWMAATRLPALRAAGFDVRRLSAIERLAPVLPERCFDFA